MIKKVVETVLAWCVVHVTACGLWRCQADLRSFLDPLPHVGMVPSVPKKFVKWRRLRKTTSLWNTWTCLVGNLRQRPMKAHHLIDVCTVSSVGESAVWEVGGHWYRTALLLDYPSAVLCSSVHQRYFLLALRWSERGRSRVIGAGEKYGLLSKTILWMDYLVLSITVFLKSHHWPSLILGTGCVVSIVGQIVSLPKRIRFNRCKSTVTCCMWYFRYFSSGSSCWTWSAEGSRTIMTCDMSFQWSTMWRLWFISVSIEWYFYWNGTQYLYASCQNGRA